MPLFLFVDMLLMTGAYFRMYITPFCYGAGHFLAVYRVLGPYRQGPIA